jgi:hypothetical protein
MQNGSELNNPFKPGLFSYCRSVEGCFEEMECFAGQAVVVAGGGKD